MKMRCVIMACCLACAPSVANRGPAREPATESSLRASTASPSGGSATTSTPPTGTERSAAPGPTNVPPSGPARATRPAEPSSEALPFEALPSEPMNEPLASDVLASDVLASDAPPAEPLAATDGSAGGYVDALCSCLLGRDGSYALRGPEVTGALPAAIPEASGMVTSRFSEEIFWTHNDSGHAAELFAVHDDGTLLARVELSVDARDWEDLAAGPCDAADEARSCLYVGDFGDNELRASTVRVHRVREPDPRDAPRRIERVETMELRFPDGARDTEAMVVDTRGRVWLLTKRPPNGHFRLYTAPFVAGARRALESHGEVSLAPLGMIASVSMFTAADLHPRCGALIGTYYGGALGMRVDPARPESAATSSLHALPVGRGLQNEAIAFTADGYRHAIEGERAAIQRFRCTPR